MLDFLTSNLATIVVAAVVFGAWGFDIYKMVKNAKAGKHSCSGNCGDCGGCSGCCH